MINKTVVDTLERMRAGGPPADLVSQFAVPVPSMVICHLLGVPYGDHAFFQDRSRVLLAWGSAPEAVLAAADELHSYLSDLVATRLSSHGGDDLISRLADRVVAGEMTEHELVGPSLLLLIAAYRPVRAGQADARAGAGLRGGRGALSRRGRLRGAAAGSDMGEWARK